MSRERPLNAKGQVVKLLLVFLLACVLLGLTTDRLSARTYVYVIGGSVLFSGLLFTFQRFWL